MSNEIDLAQLDKLPTYDPERETPGMMELRSEFNDGDYFKVEDVRALARRASATPSSKDAGGLVLVPRAPTKEMLQAGHVPYMNTRVQDYAAMIAAAPILCSLAAPVHTAAGPSAERKYTQADMERYALHVRDVALERSAGAAAKTEQDDGLSSTYQWLARSARAGLPEVREAALTMMAYYQGAEFPEATAAGAGRAQMDFESFTLAELDEIETAARAAPAIWYGTYQIIDGISDEKAVELIEACSPDSIITLVRQARAALARAPLPAQGENVDAANAGELDLDNTAKEALRDLSHVENHLEQSDAPTKVKNRAVDVRLCIKELRAALNDRAGAQDGQAVDDARDAARWRFIVKDGKNISGRFTLVRADDSGRVDELHGGEYNRVIDAAMSASRPDDKGGD